MPEQIRFTGINSEAEHFMAEALRQADWQTREAVEKVFGVSLPED